MDWESGTVVVLETLTGITSAFQARGSVATNGKTTNAQAEFSSIGSEYARRT